MTMSRARSRSIPLCLRRSWYAAANRPRSSGSVGLSSVAAEMSTPSRAGPLLDLAGLAEDRQVGDATPQHRVGGLEDPVVVALGQHDVAPVADGPVDELVLEHQRRHRPRTRDLEPVEQHVAVDALVEQRQGGGHLARRVLVQPAADRRQRLRGVAGVEVGRHDRHRRAEAVDQPGDLLGQVEPAVEHDARHLREVRRHLRRQHAEHHLGPVPRRHHDRALEEPVEHVRQRHRRDHDARALLRQQRLLAADEGAVAGGHQVGHRRRAQQRLLRQRERRDTVPVERLDDRLEVAVRHCWRRSRTACRGWRSAR